MQATNVVINCFAILILAVLLFNFRKMRADRFLSDQRVFEYMLMTNILILIFDCGTWILDDQLFPGARTLNLISTLGFYALNPVMALCYYIYCELKAGKSRKQVLQYFPFYSLPFFIHLILTAVSFFRPLLFNLDEFNHYSRGPLFFLSLVLSYVLIFYSFIKIFIAIYRVSDGSKDMKIYKSLLTFPLAPIVGGLVQVLFPELSVIWVSTVISLLVIFINIQNSQITTDPLTGLFNRRQLIPYLNWKIYHRKKGCGLYLIMLDADDLKSINDRFGHIVGDDALIHAAGMIKALAGKDDFVGRYGGDEFIVVTEREDAAVIESIVSRIEDGAIRSSDPKKSYTLTLSAGYAVWSDGYSTPDDFIADADSMMYARKHRRKALLSSDTGCCESSDTGDNCIDSY